MFWIFLLFSMGALTFWQLGAYSAMFGVLTFALKLAMVVIAVLVAVFIWRKVARKGRVLRALATRSRSQ